MAKDEIWRDVVENEVDLSKDVNKISTEKLKDYFDHLRLRVYADSREKAPAPLVENKLSLLPLRTGGDYVLVRGDKYADLAYDETPSKYRPDFPIDLKMLHGAESESSYIRRAKHSGCLNHFLSDNLISPEKPFYFSAQGRRRTTQFSYEVDDNTLTVDSYQMEIDEGFESEDDVVLLEAKTKKADSLNLRQIYYPYRHYKDETGKNVLPVFFVYDRRSATYNFWLINFEDPDNLFSYDIVRHGRYQFYTADRLRLRQLLKNADTVRSASIIPQADKLDKVMHVPAIIAESENDPQGKNALSKEEIAAEVEYVGRQGDYYANAAKSLELVQRRHGDRGPFILTEKGREFLDLEYEERVEFILQQMTEIHVFRCLLDELIHQGSLTQKRVAEIIDEEREDINGATPKRRAQSLHSWMQWLAEESPWEELQWDKDKKEVNYRAI